MRRCYGHRPSGSGQWSARIRFFLFTGHCSIGHRSSVIGHPLGLPRKTKKIA
jgi:hypothetical protein